MAKKFKQTGTCKEIDISKIRIFSGHPRSGGYWKKTDPKMQELMASIKEIGLLHPVLVTPKTKQDIYWLIIGARRLFACLHLGHKTIRGFIREGEK